MNAEASVAFSMVNVPLPQCRSFEGFGQKAILEEQDS
jgi:hypothetical protein